ncbi:MAG TPA: AbrB/MazE/SpoVT family DNA-binding domain-containing protein [Rhizomicrobium sp.]|jgi:antitoxin MazE
MQVKIARWGNSVGVRIPRDVARSAGLSEGVHVEIEAKGDRIVLSRARPHYRLEDLLAGMTPRAMRAAFDWESDRGREAVDE